MSERNAWLLSEQERNTVWCALSVAADHYQKLADDLERVGGEHQVYMRLVEQFERQEKEARELLERFEP